MYQRVCLSDYYVFILTGDGSNLRKDTLRKVKKNMDKYLAMDVNQSGAVTVFDLIILRNLILGLLTELPGNDSWRFIEENQLASITFNQQDSHEYSMDILPVDSTPNANGTVVLNYVGIKIGDANGSAAAGF